MKSNGKDFEKGFYVKYIIATICLISILAISITHSDYMEKKADDISNAYLSKVSVQNADVISGQIDSGLKTADVIASMIADGEDVTLEEIGRTLQTEAQNSNFITMGVVFADGEIVFTSTAAVSTDAPGISGAAVAAGGAPDGRSLLAQGDWDLINKILSGNSGQAARTTRAMNGKAASLYAVPIQRGQTAGVLAVLYDERFFDSLVIPGPLDEEGCIYIADGEGTILYASGGNAAKQYQDLTRKLAAKWGLEGESGEQIRRDIEQRKNGTIRCDETSKGVYISYSPLGIQDWYLVSLVKTDFFETSSGNFYEDIFPDFIYVLVMILTLAVYFIYMRNQRFKRLERKMQIEAINDESYRMIMEETDDIIFEYDTVDKTYFHTTNFRKNFGYDPTKYGLLGSMEYDYVHPDDVVRFVEMYERMRQDRTVADAEVRIINSDGDYLWTRIYMLGVFDQKGKLARVIGKIVNIDEKKKEIQYLKEKADTDSATGVLNKQTTEDMIRTFLNAEGKFGKHAMLMIDIDDFKSINDDFGHRVGDAVISALGTELNRIFRSGDIKGRVGGDEFMVLMKDIDSEGKEFIANKAGDICQLFGNYKFEGNKRINFSASIGIAFYDMDGKTYEELYEAADRALYNCKNYKKGTFAFCKETDTKLSSK